MIQKWFMVRTSGLLGAANVGELAVPKLFLSRSEGREFASTEAQPTRMFTPVFPASPNPDPTWRPL